jgi:hypothetical protein
MSPRVKRPRAELPKTNVQQGAVGCFPLQSWSLSALYHQRCASIIGFRDAENTLLAKSKSLVQLSISCRKSEPLSLKGKLFNGLSDAFYRGQLPEVILVCPPDAQRVTFVNDLADYLEQLVAMGFFSEKLPPERVALYVPCFILLGHGLWFSRMMAMLAGFMKDLKYHALPLPADVQQAILARFVRGSAPEADWGGLEEDMRFELTPLPQVLRLGGGSAMTRTLTQKALRAYGWSAELEEAARNPVERLELQGAAWRLSSVVIPGLAAQKLLSQAEAKKLTPLVQQAILNIGRQRQAFAQTEDIVIAPSVKEKGNLSATKNMAAGVAGQELLKGLSAYATALGLTREKEIFESLAERVTNGNTLG